MKEKLKLVGKFLTENRPEILQGAGLALVLGGAGWAIAQTFKAARRIDSRVSEKEYIPETDTWEEVPVTTKDLVKEVAPLYIGPAIMVTAGVVIDICGIADGRSRLLAAESTLHATEFVAKKVNEVIEERHGKEEASQIQTEARQRAVSQDYGADGDAPERTGNGAELFYEPLTGKYFYSDKATIRQAVANLDNQFPDNGAACLTDWLVYMNLGDSELADNAEWVYDPIDCRGIGVHFDNWEGKADRTCLKVLFDPAPRIR